MDDHSRRLPMNAAFRRLLRLLPFLVLAALPLPPAAAQGAGVDIQTLLERSEGAPKRGILYEVSDDAGTAHLFGTIHLGKAAFYPLGSDVTRAFVASPCLAVEADVTDTGAVSGLMAEFAVYPEGDGFAAHLPPALAARAAALAGRLRLPAEGVQRMRPWMLGTTLAAADMMQDGYQPAFGADLVLLSLARALGKPVLEVESLRAQLSLFGGLTAGEQEALLADTLDQIERGEGRRQAGALVDAWARADGAGVEAALAAEESRWPAALGPVYARLGTGRNGSMADRIERLMHEGRNCFFAVGAAHLVGPDNIVSILQRRGYRVRRL